MLKQKNRFATAFSLRYITAIHCIITYCLIISYTMFYRKYLCRQIIALAYLFGNYPSLSCIVKGLGAALIDTVIPNVVLLNFL